MTETLYVIQRDSKNQFHSATTQYNWSSHELNDSVVMTADQLIGKLLGYGGRLPDNSRIRLVRFTPPVPKYEIIQ